MACILAETPTASPMIDDISVGVIAWNYSSPVVH